MCTAQVVTCFLVYSNGSSSFFDEPNEHVPALVFTGVPEIPANATNTIALWTGVTASGGAFRSRLDVPRRLMIPLIITSFIGGILGAFLLLNTPEHTFRKVLPWLMLGATVLFLFSKRLARGHRSALARDASTAAIVGA